MLAIQTMIELTWSAASPADDSVSSEAIVFGPIVVKTTDGDESGADDEH
jgi:hypothetical protein